MVKTLQRGRSLFLIFLVWPRLWWMTLCDFIDLQFLQLEWPPSVTWLVGVLEARGRLVTEVARSSWLFVELLSEVGQGDPTRRWLHFFFEASLDALCGLEVVWTLQRIQHGGREPFFFNCCIIDFFHRLHHCPILIVCSCTIFKVVWIILLEALQVCDLQLSVRTLSSAIFFCLPFPWLIAV